MTKMIRMTHIDLAKLIWIKIRVKIYSSDKNGFIDKVIRVAKMNQVTKLIWMTKMVWGTKLIIMTIGSSDKNCLIDISDLSDKVDSSNKTSCRDFDHRVIVLFHLYMFQLKLYSIKNLIFLLFVLNYTFESFCHN